VKKEPPSAPPTRGRSSGALIIREGARTSSPPARGRKWKPRKEDAAAAAEAVRAEDAALREAIARSLVDLVPVDNSMSMDAMHWERERRSSSGSCWTWRPHGAAPPPQHNPPEARRAADAATRRRRWIGVQPLGPRPEQPAGAATAGRRRRLRRRRRRRLHGILSPFGHVERRV
jgi:hypothetical protein